MTPVPSVMNNGIITDVGAKRKAWTGPVVYGELIDAFDRVQLPASEFIGGRKIDGSGGQLVAARLTICLSFRSTPSRKAPSPPAEIMR